MRFSVSIEWLCSHAGIIRLHEGAACYGDPYIWSCCVHDDGDGVAALKGVCSPLPFWGFRSISSALADEGFVRYRYEKRRRDRIHVVEKEIKRGLFRANESCSGDDGE